MLSTKDKLIKIKNEPAQWSQKLNAIKTNMNKFEDAKRKHLPNPEQNLNTILSTYWDVFHTHNAYEKQYGPLPSDLKYDVGIFLVGFSTLPIVLSLAEIHPTKEIYFLYSKETEPMLQEIANRINVMRPTYLPSVSVKKEEIKRSSDPVQTFKRIKEIIDKVGDKRIALDLTGGKKTMLGGGFTGGAILGLANSTRSSDCDMFYVDSLEYNPQTRAPMPGTEFLNLLKNPYDVYNVQTVAQAEELFYEHNYEAAMHLWDEVQEKLGDHADRYGLQNEQDAVKKNHCMADCYSLWDAFDYKAADESARDNGDLWGYSSKHVNGQIDVLNILCQAAGRQMLFDLANEARVIHYALDRYQNGIRAQASDKLDDAIVRFTQVIEMLCIYKICQIASTRNLIERTTGRSLHETWCADKDWRISPLIKFLFGETSDYDNEYEILDCSEFLPEADYIRVSDIIELIQPRNHFIHFTRRVSLSHAERNTNNLKELAKKFLKNLLRNYCHGTDLCFDKLLELHEFRQL